MLDLNSSIKDICDDIWDKDNPDHVAMKEDWFKATSHLFDGKSAMEMLKSPRGARRVKQVLLAGIYGVYL